MPSTMAPLKRKESIAGPKRSILSSNKKQKLDSGRAKTPRQKPTTAPPLKASSDDESEDDFLDGITGEKTGALRALSDTSSDAGDDGPINDDTASPKQNERPVKSTFWSIFTKLLKH